MGIARWLSKALEVILVAIIAFQALLMMATVVSRYVLNSPIIWTDEVIRYSLIWMTFAGAALATKDKTHIDVDVIDNVLSRRSQKIINVFVDCAVVAFMAFLLFYGVKMVDYQRGGFGETLHWLNQGYIYASIPVGAVATIVLIVSKYFSKETPDASMQTDPEVR